MLARLAKHSDFSNISLSGGYIFNGSWGTCYENGFHSPITSISDPVMFGKKNEFAHYTV